MKKIICILLIAALMTPALVSCSEESVNSESDSTVQSEMPAESTEDTAASEESITKYSADVPQGISYDGESFTVLTYPLVEYIWNDVDWSAEGYSGEAINDAVYTRIMNTESKLNIDIKTAYLTSRSDTATLSNSVRAQDNAYQLVTNSLDSTFAMSQDGVLAELNDYSLKGTLNLQAEWWDQNSLEDLSIANKNYMLTGDIGTMYKKAIGAVMFNKKIHNDYNLESPYELMEQRKWTIDNMVLMGSAVSDDRDGDGKMTDQDCYGLICFRNMLCTAMVGCDVQMITKNAEDIPEVTLYSEKSVSVIEKLSTLMYNPNITWSWTIAGTGETPAFAMYQQDQALFYYGELHAVATMREMESPFGILPMPLYDENQEEYYHCVNMNAAAVYSVPITNIEYEMTGYIMDTLGAESKNVLTPAYYEQTLQGKVARDEESVRSLDIIIGSIRYDMGFINTFNITPMLETMADNYSTDLASAYKKQEKMLEKLLIIAVKKYSDT